MHRPRRRPSSLYPAKAEVNPAPGATWQIIDGRLVLNYSADVQKMFNKDPEGTLKKGDANWPKLVADHAK